MSAFFIYLQLKFLHKVPGLKEVLINALNSQIEIYGDELYQKVDLGEPAQMHVKKSAFVAESKPADYSNNLFLEDFQKAKNLDELDLLINKCTKCSLGTTRNSFVFGTGNPHADVMLIGEAPGAEEDNQGIPFVGRAGKLLDDIMRAIKFERSELYIANILKCRPPNNRDPLPEEMETCFPHLYKQIELIQPKLILCLGRIAAQAMLNTKTSLTKIRGEIFEYNGIKIMATYHPAALLRNPGWKRGTWEDVQKFRKLYDEMMGI